MSDQSWIDEYYPVEAKDVSEAGALEHSLRKWRGLRPANLARHGLSEPPIWVDCTTCALCVQCSPHDNGCAKCPLYQVRGNVRCDRTRQDEKRAPYWEWTKRSNPEPMIQWLHRAEEKEIPGRPNGPKTTMNRQGHGWVVSQWSNYHGCWVVSGELPYSIARAMLGTDNCRYASRPKQCPYKSHSHDTERRANENCTV
jgi:hypothetical protein